MTARGYVTNGHLDVERYLGLSSPLVGDLLAYEQQIEEAAESWIDLRCRQSWLQPPQTAERHDLEGMRYQRWGHSGVIYLKYKPVSSVTAINYRTWQPGDNQRLLTAATDYELYDPQRGELHFYAGYQSSQSSIFVDYVPNNPPPAHVSRAATEIVAHSMRVAFNPERLGVDSVKLDEASLSYSSIDNIAIAIPNSVMDKWLHGEIMPVFA